MRVKLLPDSTVRGTRTNLPSNRLEYVWHYSTLLHILKALNHLSSQLRLI